MRFGARLKILSAVRWSCFPCRMFNNCLGKGLAGLGAKNKHMVASGRLAYGIVV